jgi:hypothetical protein
MRDSIKIKQIFFPDEDRFSANIAPVGANLDKKPPRRFSGRLPKGLLLRKSEIPLKRARRLAFAPSE